MNTNILYQYSLVSAVLSGVAGTGTSAGDLALKGDHGLGTFQHFDGEMVMIDGQVYQYRSDGTARPREKEAILPFAQVTRFEPTSTVKVDELDRSSAMEILRSSHPDTANLYHAVRIDGFFQKITLHVARKQKFEGESGAEILKALGVVEFEDVRGTAFGFQSPPYTRNGFSVPGLHLHFVSADRDLGGHAVEFRVTGGGGGGGGATISSAVVSRVEMELPGSLQFNRTTLESVHEGVFNDK